MIENTLIKVAVVCMAIYIAAASVIMFHNGSQTKPIEQEETQSQVDLEPRAGNRYNNFLLDSSGTNDTEFIYCATKTTTTKKKVTNNAKKKIVKTTKKKKITKKNTKKKNTKKKKTKKKKAKKKYTAKNPTTSQYYLAVLIAREAGGCSTNVQRMVGTVVMNRVKDKRFPNSINGVIFQPGQYYGVCYGMSFPSWATNHKHFYKVAADLMNGKRWLPKSVVWQAEFPQGRGTYLHIGNQYFCY